MVSFQDEFSQLFFCMKAMQQIINKSRIDPIFSVSSEQ